MDFLIESLTTTQCKNIIKHPMLIDEFFFLEGDSKEPPKPIKNESLYLGRSWHGIHFL